jgi:hypothetical protein
MRTTLLGLAALLFLISCGSGGDGGGGGFVPTGKIAAVAERRGAGEVTVGGAEEAVSPGALVRVTNLSTRETKEARASRDGSFEIGFTAGTDSLFRVEVQEDGIEETIGVTLLEDAVTRNIATLGSVPTDIEVRGGRAYVGRIVLPLGQDPVKIAFIDSERAAVPNLIGQSIAILNLATLTCDVIIANEDGDYSPCAEKIIIPGAFEEPSGIAVLGGRLFVTNNNLDPNFNPAGAGFITVFNLDTLELLGFIEASGANSGNPKVVGDKLWVLNGGNVLFDPAEGDFTCDQAFVPSLDEIDPATLEVVGTIEMPLDGANPKACLPSNLATTPDGRLAYMGLGILGGMFKADLSTRTLLRGASNPIFVTSPTELDFVADIVIRGDGMGFFTLFNTDRVGVIDTGSDKPNPFPFVSPFPAGLKAFDPSSQFFEGVQFLALSGGFPDIYFITTISNKLGSIDTSRVTAP